MQPNIHRPNVSVSAIDVYKLARATRTRRFGDWMRRRLLPESIMQRMLEQRAHENRKIMGEVCSDFLAKYAAEAGLSKQRCLEVAGRMAGALESHLGIARPYVGVMRRNAIMCVFSKAARMKVAGAKMKLVEIAGDMADDIGLVLLEVKTEGIMKESVSRN
jgi:hypothetical protein